MDKQPLGRSYMLIPFSWEHLSLKEMHEEKNDYKDLHGAAWGPSS